jgi:hypothetical protein
MYSIIRYGARGNIEEGEKVVDENTYQFGECLLYNYIHKFECI